MSHTHYVAGTYTGDGTDGRVISLGFKPVAVIVFSTELGSNLYRNIGFATQGASQEPSEFATGSGSTRKVLEVVDTGFKVWYYARSGNEQIGTNTENSIYNYIAFK